MAKASICASSFLVSEEPQQYQFSFLRAIQKADLLNALGGDVLCAIDQKAQGIENVYVLTEIAPDLAFSRESSFVQTILREGFAA